MYHLIKDMFIIISGSFFSDFLLHFWAYMNSSTPYKRVENPASYITRNVVNLTLNNFSHYLLHFKGTSVLFKKSETKCVHGRQWDLCQVNESIHYLHIEQVEVLGLQLLLRHNRFVMHSVFLLLNIYGILNTALLKMEHSLISLTTNVMSLNLQHSRETSLHDVCPLSPTSQHQYLLTKSLK